MSVNCIKCGVNERNGPDLLCEECRHPEKAQLVTVTFDGKPVRTRRRRGVLEFMLENDRGSDRILYRESPRGPEHDDYFGALEVVDLREGDYLLAIPDSSPGGGLPPRRGAKLSDAQVADMRRFYPEGSPIESLAREAAERRAAERKEQEHVGLLRGWAEREYGYTLTEAAGPNPSCAQAAERYTEIRWQSAIDKIVSKVYPQRDGSGTDADALALTLCEIGQAFDHLQEQVDNARRESADLNSRLLVACLQRDGRAAPAPASSAAAPIVCSCGGEMHPWNGSLVYRDAEDKVELRCVKCGDKRPLAASSAAGEYGPARCELCGDPMPPGEQMFKFHGYSGPCPTPPK